MSSVGRSEVQFYAQYMYIAGDKHHSDKERLQSLKEIAEHEVEPAYEEIKNQLLLYTLDSLAAHYKDRRSLKDKFNENCVNLYELSFQELSKTISISILVSEVVKKIFENGVKDQPQLAKDTKILKKTTLEKLELMVENMFAKQVSPNSKAEIDDLMQTVKEERDKVSGLNKTVKDLTEHNKDLQTKVDELTEDCERRLQAEAKKTNEIEELNKKLAEYQSNPQKAGTSEQPEKFKPGIDSKIETLNQEIRSKNEKKDIEIQANKDRLAQVQSDSPQSAGQQIEHERQIAELNETITKLTDEKAKETARLQSEIDDLKKEHEVAMQASKDENETLNKNHQDEVARLQERIDTLTSEISQLNKDNKSLADRLKKLEKELADYVQLLGPEGEVLTHEQRIESLAKRLENIKTNADYTCLVTLVRENPWAFISASLTLLSFATLFGGVLVGYNRGVVESFRAADKALQIYKAEKSVENLAILTSSFKAAAAAAKIGHVYSGEKMVALAASVTICSTLVGLLVDRKQDSKRQQEKI
ncbi:MAG: hypothetical protein H7A40_01525 [Chlamydiales bacterium]|nr:hypothetical protein [Chlamydiales bacterium]